MNKSKKNNFRRQHLKAGFMLIIVYFIFTRLAVAQLLYELEATPSVVSETGTIFLINEVNIKNTGADWIEIFYKSPSGKTLDLNGISFSDDSVFKKIDKPFAVASGSYILLTLKNSNADSPPNLYSAHSGLTGTTEQFIMRDRNGKILDAVCWASSTPTASEIEDQQKLFEEEGWADATTQSCIKSDSIKSNQSIIRKNLLDYNTSTDWEISSTATPGSTNTPELESAENPITQTNTTSTAKAGTTQQNTMQKTASSPLSSVSSTPSNSSVTSANKSTGTSTSKTSNTSTPTSSSTKKTAAKTSVSTSTAKTKTAAATKKSSTAKYKNGDLSDQIVLSEIYPNPDKADNKIEWVEIFNKGEEDVNLGNWQLDDKEGASKPYTFSDQTIISAGAAIIIKSDQSKLSLSNSGDQVRLINFNGDVLDQVEYEDSPKGQSYSLITVHRTENNSITPKNELGSDEREIPEIENIWLWTKNKTPEEPNLEYYEYSGTINTEANFGSENFFIIKTSAGEEKKILFTEDIIQAPLAKITFTAGSKGIFLCSYDQEEETLSLVKYEITEQLTNNGEIALLLPGIAGAAIILIAGLVFFLIKKYPQIFTVKSAQNRI